jgi:hypothetical protein
MPDDYAKITFPFGEIDKMYEHVAGFGPGGWRSYRLDPPRRLEGGKTYTVRFDEESGTAQLEAVWP